jgi:tripartite-type tricarboxylate transporter receptor subunit TctC
MRRILSVAIAALGLALGASSAHAQTFPSRQMTIIVPFAAGGPSDTIGRLLAQAMGQNLGQTIVVENVAGAGGTVGIGRVARATPDGHTLLLSHVNHATAATLYRRLDYRSVDDFAPIGIVTDGAMVITSKRDLPANNIVELMALIRRERDKLTIANAGIGSGSHLCGLMLMSALNSPMTVVPYRGTGPAMQDLIGGQVDLLCDQVTSAIGQIRGNQVKAFAVTSLARLPGLDVPTVLESGIANFEVNVWHGLYAPANTPPAVVTRLSEALRVALRDPALLRRLEELSTIAASAERATPAALGAHLRAEIAKWRPVIEAAGQFAD